MKQKNTHIIFLASALTLITACSEESSKKTGVFVDSPVGNIAYSTESTSAYTTVNGEFKYYQGESITFKIGDIELPVTPAKSIVTPFDVVGTTNTKSVSLINIARLLQTLDIDGDSANGITISDEAHVAATGMQLSFESATFDEDVINLIANAGSVQVSLVPEEAAISHLLEVVELPEYYGAANYDCRWTSEVTTDSEGDENKTGLCEMELSVADSGNDVLVTYGDGSVSYEYNGVMNGLELTFGGEIEGAKYTLSGKVVFNENFNSFTGRVSGSGVDINGDVVPFEDVISDGELAEGVFYKVK
jgi:hypothetical protein